MKSYLLLTATAILISFTGTIIINIPDLKRDNIPGNKNIYNIYSLGGSYYLSTGLGIVVVDAERYEIKESWLIGSGGNQVKVNGVTSDVSFFYAATEEGLKRASNANNLADYNNWQLLSGVKWTDQWQLSECIERSG